MGVPLSVNYGIQRHLRTTTILEVVLKKDSIVWDGSKNEHQRKGDETVDVDIH